MNDTSDNQSYVNEHGVDRRVWATELELLTYIHSFCEENGLHYYMAWGTVLGAVRHKGFIPWDDDLDIAIMREDYDKLISLSDKIDSRYTLACSQHTPGYQYSFAKLEHNGTRIEEFNYPKGRHGGIYIDIFPLDGVPSDRTEQKKLVWRNVFWKIKSNALHGYRTGIWYLKWFWPFLGFFMRLRYGKDTSLFHKKWESAFMSPTDDSEWVADLFGADLDGFVPKELFGKPTLTEFEGRLFYGPEKAERYLEYLYGDWRKLPPADKRHAAHGFTFSFSDNSCFE